MTKYMMSAIAGTDACSRCTQSFSERPGEGMTFYLKLDFSKIDGSVIVGAMNQAFFTLSTGMGGMAIFGSYWQRAFSDGGSYSCDHTGHTIAFSSIHIFPACFTFNLEVNAGPSLLFDTMAAVLTTCPEVASGVPLFFLFMVFAAMSTVLGSVRKHSGNDT